MKTVGVTDYTNLTPLWGKFLSSIPVKISSIYQMCTEKEVWMIIMQNLNIKE